MFHVSTESPVLPRAKIHRISRWIWTVRIHGSVFSALRNGNIELEDE